MYLLRSIYANGNEYKTVDEIYKMLDPKIDREEFDRLFLRLRELHYLDEHNLTHKIRINNIGETSLINLDRQEEPKRLSLVRHSQKRPIYKLMKERIKRFAKSVGIWILNNIIGVVVAGLILAYLIYKLGWT